MLGSEVSVRYHRRKGKKRKSEEMEDTPRLDDRCTKYSCHSTWLGRRLVVGLFKAVSLSRCPFDDDRGFMLKEPSERNFSILNYKAS